jgi:hypothetical protein
MANQEEDLWMAMRMSMQPSPSSPSRASQETPLPELQMFPRMSHRTPRVGVYSRSSWPLPLKSECWRRGRQRRNRFGFWLCIQG